MNLFISQPAIEFIFNQLKKNKGKALRVGVKMHGCSGLGYKIEIVKKIYKNEFIFYFNNLKITVNKSISKYLNGTKISYGKNYINEGLRFFNPNVVHSCGCGKSFHIK